MILLGLLVGARHAASASACFNYALILLPAHPADHRHAVLELRLPVGGDRYGRGLRIKPPPLLADFTTAQVARRAGARHLR